METKMENGLIPNFSLAFFLIFHIHYVNCHNLYLVHSPAPEKDIKTENMFTKIRWKYLKTFKYAIFLEKNQFQFRGKFHFSPGCVKILQKDAQVHTHSARFLNQH